MDEDGPYVFRQRDGCLKALWRCETHCWQQTWPASSTDIIIPPRYGYAYPISITPPAPVTEAVISTRWRLIAISDIHGYYAAARTLLRAHKLVDHADNWIAGGDSLVVVGDSVDCGPQVMETLWWLYRLQQQARSFGGNVHLLCGNHESMLLYGDTSYLHPRYQRTARCLGYAYPQLFSADSVLGQWLRSWPLMMRINERLFVHGGIAPALLAQVQNLQHCNAVWRASLGKPRALVETDPNTAAFHHRSLGPAWYAGYFNKEITTATVHSLCDALAVRQIVVGHVTLPHISLLHDECVIGLDSGLWQGAPGEMLFIEGDSLSRGLADGSRVALSSSANGQMRAVSS